MNFSIRHRTDCRFKIADYGFEIDETLDFVSVFPDT